jgi:hypothetical protein
VTDGTLPADNNTVSNNHVSDTHLGDGIDLCSNNNNAVSKNVVNEACAEILLGSGTGNTFRVRTQSSMLRRQLWPATSAPRRCLHAESTHKGTVHARHGVKNS